MFSKLTFSNLIQPKVTSPSRLAPKVGGLTMSSNSFRSLNGSLRRWAARSCAPRPPLLPRPQLLFRNWASSTLLAPADGILTVNGCLEVSLPDSLHCIVHPRRSPAPGHRARARAHAGG